MQTRGFSFVHSTRFETCSSSSKPESTDVDLLLTFGVLVAVFIGLVMDLLSPDGVLLGSLIILVLGGGVDLGRALRGFANSTLRRHMDRVEDTVHMALADE